MTSKGKMKGPMTHDDDPADYVEEEPADEEPEPEPEQLVATASAEPYAAGTFGGRPVFDCPFCPLHSMTSSALVEAHVQKNHSKQRGAKLA